MTFSKARFRKTDEYEIVRAATKLGYSVPGGFSKLIKHFSKNKSGNIISYANRRWSQGNVYLQSGFTLVKTLGPCYFYWGKLDKSQMFHRTKFMKSDLNKLLDTYDVALSEADNMYNNGYARYWDCGNYTFQLVIKWN